VTENLSVAYQWSEMRVSIVNMAFSCAIVTDRRTDDSAPWVDGFERHRWRWIWCRTPCEASTLWNGCLQGTEVFSYSRRIKVGLLLLLLTLGLV